jgi:hypothetical protein
MNNEQELLRAFVAHAQTQTDGESLAAVADIMADSLSAQLVEIEVQMRRLLGEVCLASTEMTHMP